MLLKFLPYDFTREAHWDSTPSMAQIITFPRQANEGVPSSLPFACQVQARQFQLHTKSSSDKDHLGTGQPPSWALQLLLSPLTWPLVNHGILLPYQTCSQTWLKYTLSC